MFAPVRNKHRFKLLRVIREWWFATVVVAAVAAAIGYSFLTSNQLNPRHVDTDILQSINKANAEIHNAVEGVVGYPGPMSPSTSRSDRLQPADHRPTTSIQTPVAKPQPQKVKKQSALPVKASSVASAPPVTQTLGIDSTEELPEFKVVPEVSLASATNEPVMPGLATSFDEAMPIIESVPDATNQTADVAVAVLEDSSATPPEPLPSAPSASIKLDANGQPIPAEKAVNSQSPSTACDSLTPIAISISVIESGCIHCACCPAHFIEPKESDITPVPPISTKENNAYKRPSREANANWLSKACCTVSEITLTKLRLTSYPPTRIGIISIRLTGVRLHRPYIKKDHAFCPIGRPPCPHCGHTIHLPP